MRTFKNLYFIFALTCLTITGVLMTGCKKEDPDPCENVSCQNGGTCNNGSCNCAAGYEGGTCATEVRSKFIASYSVQENCSPGGNFNYTMTINSSATGVQNVVINNFYGVGASVTASVSGTSINIASQTVTVNGTAVTFSGSGQINGNILTLSYTASAGVDADNCTATCTKQ